MSKLNISNINNLITYIEFVDQFKKQVNETNLHLLNDYDRGFYEYRKLNFQRSSRLEKIFEPVEETKILFSQITNPQKWIVITESWCGDSAQNLPIIAKLANLSDMIAFKIVLRDSNPDFMDLYLTNGGRSIPKLIVFDESDNELLRWGPRPAEAQDLFIKLKNEGMKKSDIYKEIHLWYGRDKGKEVEREIVKLIKIDKEIFNN